MIIRPYGDNAVLVETGSASGARRLRARLANLSIGADYVVGWASLLVVGEPNDVRRCLADLTADMIGDDGDASAGSSDARLHDVTVTFTGGDLDDVAEAVGLSVANVIDRLLAVTYTVECLGFARAFPYMSGLDARLHLPRRASPRHRVPAGSVAMAADQLGIYPMESPGGWHLIGLTDEAVFDPSMSPPARFSPGDRVRLVAA